MLENQKFFFFFLFEIKQYCSFNLGEPIPDSKIVGKILRSQNLKDFTFKDPKNEEKDAYMPKYN